MGRHELKADHDTQNATGDFQKAGIRTVIDGFREGM